VLDCVDTRPERTYYYNVKWAGVADSEPETIESMRPAPFLGIVTIALLSTSGMLRGQSPAKLEFEVASVRFAGLLLSSNLPKGVPIPQDGWMSGGPGTSDPERITYTRVQMITILKNAFGLDTDQVSGPSWIFEPDPLKTERYDIAAKVPPGSTKDQAVVMLHNLLKDRFGLKFHYEKRSFDVLTLVVARNGPKFKLSQEVDSSPSAPESDGIKSPAGVDDDGFPTLPPGRPGIVGVSKEGHMRLTLRMQTMERVAAIVGGNMGSRHVVDKTELSGKYDLRLEFAQPAYRSSAPLDGPSEPLDDFPTALERQLGLKVEKSKAQLDVLVIDHIDKLPTDN
jgi:uncharacterized protein (TIGR03435 family)